MDAVEELIQTAYAMKGWAVDSRIDKTVVIVLQHRRKGQGERG
jgi:hypothetical protein